VTPVAATAHDGTSDSVVSPDNKSLFVEGGAWTIDCYAIASNGALTRVATVFKVPKTSEVVAISRTSTWRRSASGHPGAALSVYLVVQQGLHVRLGGINESPRRLFVAEEHSELRATQSDHFATSASTVLGDLQEGCP